MRSRSGKKKENNLKIYRYSINLDEDQNEKLQAMLRSTESKNISKFITSVLFNKEIRVVKVDKVAKDYYMLLTNIYSQYRSIGVNYNQTVRAMKTNFAEKRALAMLYKLEKTTIELIKITKEIIRLTNEFEEKWLQK